MPSNSMLPNKHVQSLSLLAGSPESTQEHCHKSRRTLMLPQDRKIPGGTTNHLKMKTDSPALALEPSRIPHHTRQIA